MRDVPSASERLGGAGGPAGPGPAALQTRLLMVVDLP